MKPERVIRFAGHDMTMTGKQENMMPIMRAIDALEKNPNMLTDTFNASSNSDKFYRFGYNADIEIRGEMHFLIAIATKMRDAENHCPSFVNPVAMVLRQIEYAFDINGVRTNGGIASDATDANFAERYRIPSHQAKHCKVYKFSEHDLSVTGEMHHILELAEALRSVEHNGGELSTTISDLVYQIEYAFDIDGVRSDDSEIPFDPNFADQYVIN